MDGQCATAPACKSDKVCGGMGLVCDKAAGRCVICLSDSDCDAGLSCKANHCLPPATPCKSSKVCAAGEVCDKAAGVCVECASDEDCGAGFRCWQTRCVALLCQPKQVACKDKSTRRTCDAQGAAWVDQACPAGTACAAGACVGSVCEPGKSRCQGGARQVCAADGTAWQAAPCGEGKTCAAGVCEDQLCTPGALSCLGDKLMKCAASGLATSLAKDCAATGGTCASGACQSQSQSCQAGAVKCVGLSERSTCKADGSGWQSSACPSGAVCVAGACVAKSCEPNSKTCVGDQVGVCNATGTKLVPGADCAATGQLCQAGACVAKSPIQQGFQLRAGFGELPDSSKNNTGLRVLRQGWLLGRSCSGGLCQQGGFLP